MVTIDLKNEKDAIQTDVAMVGKPRQVKLDDDVRREKIAWTDPSQVRDVQLSPVHVAILLGAM